MQTGTPTTHCRLTRKANIRVKARLGKASVYSDRLLCEKCGF